MDPYALPPGFTFEILGAASARMWLAIVDRCGKTVLALPLSSEYGWYDTIENLWTILIDYPERAREHTAAFMVWRLRRSPLDDLVDL